MKGHLRRAKARDTGSGVETAAAFKMKAPGMSPEAFEVLVPAILLPDRSVVKINPCDFEGQVSS